MAAACISYYRPMTGPQRHFLGWDKSPARSVAEFLLREQKGRILDFSGHVVVVPTKEAGRRLRQQIVELAEARQQTIVGLDTVVPTWLYRNHRRHVPLASAWQIASAWREVLLSQQRSNRLTGLFPSGAATPSTDWALSIGSSIETLREQLGRVGLTIQDVANTHAGIIAPERERWADLATLEARFLESLVNTKMVDPIMDRLRNALDPALPTSLHTLTLAILPDFTPLSERLLTHVQQVGIHILVAAPASERDTFDSLGRPDTKHWQSRAISIPEFTSRVIPALDMAGQAHAVSALLTPAHRHAVSIAVPDRALIPSLQEHLDPRGIHVADPSDRSASQHPLPALVAAWLDCAAAAEMRQVGRLLRHPDLLDYLQRHLSVPASTIVSDFDLFLEQHRPLTLDNALAITQGPRFSPRRKSCIGAVLLLIKEWIVTPPGLNHVTRLREWLGNIYRERRANAADSDLLAAAALVDEILHRAGEMPTDEFHSVLRHVLNDVTLPGSAEPDAIAAEGWLELIWNTAPLAIITSMNEGFVPTHRRHNLFLPEPVRTRLGMDSDASTLARDSYLLTLLLASRESCHFIVAREGAEGDPLKPSRLLFRAGSAAERAAMAEHVFAGQTIAGSTVPATLRAPFRLTLPAFTPPSPLSITLLNDYLTCPFHCFLRHVLDMEARPEFQPEPTPAQFGELVHRVLHLMARDTTLRTTRSADVLEKGLLDLLHDVYAATFGNQPSIAITLSRAVAEQRLRTAVPHEIELRLAGWEILHAEHELSSLLDGIPILGRIDRIDRGPDGRLRVLDYKTGRSRNLPDKMHLRRARADTPAWQLHLSDSKSRWVNLQLPLYAWLLQQTVPDSAGITPGIFNLGPVHDETRVSLWEDFSAADLESACSTAAEAARRITAGVFWPPADSAHSLRDLSAPFHDDPANALDAKSLQRIQGANGKRP